jgi:hypothetical protein
MRKEELGIRNAAQPRGLTTRRWGGGREFLIPHSKFLIDVVVLNFPPDIDTFWNTRLLREVQFRVRNTQ